MLKSYFSIAWRNLSKNRIFTLLNLGGLTVSLAASIIIYFWVTNELNYDTAGSNAGRVFRVALTLQSKGQADKKFASTAAPLAPALVKDFPQIEKAVRFQPFNATLGFKNEHFFTKKFFFADSTFFDVFGFPLLEGNPHTALNGSNSLIITESVAKKYFGDEEALGKTITCSDSIPLTVTGIMKDLPVSNHFQVDMVCSFRVLESKGFDNTTGWWQDDYYTYVLLNDPSAAPALGVRLENIMDKYNGKQNKAMGFTGLLFLQPLRSIHLHSNLDAELSPNGSSTSLNIFIAIAIFLVVIACINYVNLTTANSFKRAKEIGIRKVAGAGRGQLIAQFLSESVLITVTALIMAIGLALLCLPGFNQIAATQISMSVYFSWGSFFALIGFVVLLGMLAGLYPAFYLSGVHLVKALKNGMEKKGSLLSLRKALVVFQFTLCVILIVAMIIAEKQLHYMQSQTLGFDQEKVLTIPLRTPAQSLVGQQLKRELERDPGVAVVTNSSSIPGLALNNIVTLPEGVPQDQQQTMNTLVVDFDFLNTYKLKMAAGRDFSKEYATDSSAFILNETAVREIGWGNPQNAVGKGFEWGLGKKGKIIGVVRDFHFHSLQEKIAPIVLHVLPANSGWYNFISVRLNTRDARQTIALMQDTWKRLLPANPFDYYFVDENYNKQYQAEERLGHLSVLFSLLTIFISCLGLFGLVMVAVSQRTKEIGVRKVLGASVTGIAALLSTDFLRLIAVSIGIALPVSAWAMRRWLADFAYRISLSWWIFAGAAVLVILIALVTISFQAVRAALANPIKNLRME